MLVGERDDAVDIAQEVAVDVIKSIHQVREPKAFDAWVHRITSRRAKKALRVRALKRRSEIPLVFGLEVADHKLVDGQTRLETREVLGSALAGLSTRQRIVIALRYVHDLPTAQIAEVLDCPEGTVDSLLSRARESLRGSEHLRDFDPRLEGI